MPRTTYAMPRTTYKFPPLPGNATFKRYGHYDLAKVYIETGGKNGDVQVLKTTRANEAEGVAAYSKDGTPQAIIWTLSDDMDGLGVTLEEVEGSRSRYVLFPTLSTVDSAMMKIVKAAAVSGPKLVHGRVVK